MMNNERPWSDEDIKSLEEMWRSGMATRAIGEKLNRGRNSILGRIHRSKLSNNAERRENIHDPHSWSKIEIAKLKEMREAGTTIAEIAEALNRPRDSVSYKARKVGAASRWVRPGRHRNRASKKPGSPTPTGRKPDGPMPEGGLVLFDILHGKHCCYPTYKKDGEQVYCGKVVDNKSYCNEHYAIMYIPTPKGHPNTMTRPFVGFALNPKR